MSSYIINDKTLNRILTFFNNWDFYENSKIKFSFWDLGKVKLKGKKFPSFLETDEQEDILERIGLKLKQLNAEAVGQRYNEKVEEQEFEYKKEKCNIFQAYNHLRCLTYQMSEGDVPTTEIYKLLEKIENLMAVEIANETKEVKDAEWDAEE